ncbi:MAG: hypothetical protein JW943_00720 [Deltaproteobacteria bacterium]|nr:hypothetical protein [Deltaproteobacteria bacterium]
MKLGKYGMPLAQLLLVIFLFGCSTISDSFKQGQELSQANRWDEAIPYFEKSLSEDPERQDYKDALLKAKQEAAKFHFDKARRILAGATEPADMSVLQQTLKEIDLACKLDPNNQEISSFSSTVQGKASSLQDAVKSLYDQVNMDIQREDWEAAVNKLAEINKLYPGYEDTGRLQSKVTQEGAKLYYQQGVALGKQEEWKMAKQAFKASMDLNPSYYDVASLYEDAKSKDSADYYLREGGKAQSVKNWERAILMYEKAQEYEPGNLALTRKIKDLKATASQIYFDDAHALFKQGMLNRATKKIELIRKYTPAVEKDAAYKEFIKALSEKIFERAGKYAEQQQWGNALVWYQKCEALNPNYPELFQKVLDTKDQINKRIKKSIAVFDFSSPKNSEDAGRIVANKLITFLHKNASGDIRIIERENLQSILREMQLGQTGIVDTKTVQSLGKMRGIDTFIMGNVLHYSATTTDTPSTSQVKVEVGEDTVSNPEYLDWRISNPKPTEEDLKNAPPRTIVKKNYQFVSYRQGAAKISAIIEISYKLVDTMTGENIFTNTIPGRLIREDKYSDAVPAANIAYDPLELPTEIEVLDELTNQKISEVAQSVVKNFQSLEVAYFNEAQQQQKRRSIDQAIEKYMDAVYDEKLKGIATPITSKSLESIEMLIQDK